MKIIELQPGNRVKMLVAPNFDWIPNGPIQQFFEAENTGRVLRFEVRRAG